MKRLIAILLSCCIFLTGCSVKDALPQDSSTNEMLSEPTLSEEVPDTSSEESVEDLGTAPTAPPVFNDLSDTELHRYLEDDVYAQLVNQLNSDDYFVEDVQVQYLSKEYLEELEYNSKENVFFGYALSDLVDALGDTKYVFTLGEDGQTAVKQFEKYGSTFDSELALEVIKNVAIGSGVILVCATVSIVAARAGATRVSAIFAAAAKEGTKMALSGALISGVTGGVVTGIQTGDLEAAKKAALLEASEEFKWGAIIGAVTGAVEEAVSPGGGLQNSEPLDGLSKKQAAQIQKDSKYPVEIIKGLHSMDEYNVYKAAGVKPQKVNGVWALTRKIDLKRVDKNGLTNLQRMQKGLAPLDKSGIAHELHHMGQRADGPLVILTKAEHIQGGNNTILHFKSGASEVSHGADWQRQVKDFWKAYAEAFS